LARDLIGSQHLAVDDIGQCEKREKGDRDRTSHVVSSFLRNRIAVVRLTTCRSATSGDFDAHSISIFPISIFPPLVGCSGLILIQPSPCSYSRE
jgi:hypothetical protein